MMTSLDTDHVTDDVMFSSVAAAFQCTGLDRRFPVTLCLFIRLCIVDTIYKPLIFIVCCDAVLMQFYLCTTGFAAATWRNTRFTTARRHRSEAGRSTRWYPSRRTSRAFDAPISSSVPSVYHTARHHRSEAGRYPRWPPDW